MQSMRTPSGPYGSRMVVNSPTLERVGKRCEHEVGAWLARGCVVNEGDRTLKVVVLVNIESTLLKCVIDEFRKLREEPVNRSKWRRGRD